MSVIEGIHWVSLDSSMQEDIGKWIIVAITAQEGRGNEGLRSLKDGDTGIPQIKQSRGTGVLGKGEGDMACILK